MARTGVRIPITSDASGVQSGVRDAERALDKLNRSASRSFSGLKLGALAAGAAVGGVLVSSLRTGIDELIEAEKVSAQTAAAIKSTGGAAGVTSKHIEEMASKLQALTGKEDDAIQATANLALSFTNVRNRGEGLNAILDRTLKAVVDISARTGKELDPVMRALAKAVNDPEKALTGLTRVGVTFTEGQQKQIKALMENGRTLQAQKLVLAEVEKRYKGAGEAAGNTLTGKLDRLKRAWESVSESMAKAFLPALTRIADGLLNNQAKLQGFADKVGKFIDAIIRGDWEQAGDTIVRGLSRGMGAALMKVPGGGAIARLLGFEGAEPPRDVVINVLYGGGLASNGGVTTRRQDRVASSGSGPGARQRRAVGGVIHGPEGAGDIVPAMLSPGEVVLNHTQQRMLGVDRVNEVLARTGGVLGGLRYAQGGWVHPAPGSRRGGGPGGGTHSFSAAPNNWQSDMAWDLMGYDGMRVYAAHAGRVSATRPFSSDPRFWGRAVYLDVPGGQFYYKHLKTVAVEAGQSVEAGDLLGTLGSGVNGGPHLHLGATSRGILDRAVNAPSSSGRAVKNSSRGHRTPDSETRTTGVVTSPMVGGSGPTYPGGLGKRSAGYVGRDAGALVEWRPGMFSRPGSSIAAGYEFTGPDGRTYFQATDGRILNEGAPGFVQMEGGQDPADLVPQLDQGDIIRARTGMLMAEWGLTSRGSGDIGSGGATALSAAFPGGRTVTLTVGATSLVSAVASAAGDQGYSTPAVVPAGV